MPRRSEEPSEPPRTESRDHAAPLERPAPEASVSAERPPSAAERARLRRRAARERRLASDDLPRPRPPEAPALGERAARAPRFSFGGNLSRSLGALIANFPSFFLLTLLVELPAGLFAISPIIWPERYRAFLRTFPNPQVATAFWVIAVTGAYLLLRPIATAAVTYGVLQDLRGRHGSVWHNLRHGLRRAVPVLLVAIAGGLLVVLGLVLFVIPGVILACGYYVATPVAVAEPRGVVAALRRSWELTRGARVAIFGVQALLSFVVMLAHQAFDSWYGVPEHALSGKSAVGYIGLLLVVHVLADAFLAVSSAVAYHDLRATRDGLDSAAIGRAFD